MLGGAGKYLGLILASVLVPFYGCLALGILFFQYIWAFLLAAFLLMPVCVMGVQSYKHGLFAGCRAFGLTMQKEDKRDEFDYIAFGPYDDLGDKPENGINFHRYSMQHKLTKQRYILAIREEIERLAYAPDEVFVGSWIETLPTTYATGVRIGMYTKHISIFDRDEPGFVAKYILRRGEPPTSEEIPIVQIYATNEIGQAILMRRFRPEEIQPLSQTYVEDMKKAFEFIDDAGVRTELGALKETIKTLDKTIIEQGGWELKYLPPQPETTEGMSMRQALIIIGVVVIAIVAMVATFKLLGVF